jgi:hypothetical protein
VPANGSIVVGWNVGRPFHNGLGIAMTGLAADLDATVITAGALIVNLDYH